MSDNNTSLDLFSDALKSMGSRLDDLIAQIKEYQKMTLKQREEINALKADLIAQKQKNQEMVNDFLEKNKDELCKKIEDRVNERISEEITEGVSERIKEEIADNAEDKKEQ